MKYINVMPYMFENMANDINMWHAVMMDALFNELSDLSLELRTRLPRSSLSEILVEQDNGPGRGVEGFTLDS